MANSITFFVPGKPQPAGSKRAFVIKRKNGSFGASVTDACEKSKDWKSMVAFAAHEHKPDLLWDGPLELELWFHIVRAKGHFGSGKNSRKLKESAPKRPTVKPDTTKLTRAVEDALTGIVWKDDAQIVDQHCHKVYADEYGVYVTVRQVNNNN